MSGPHGGTGGTRRPVPYSQAGGWQDNVAEMLAMVRSHPTLSWIKPGDALGLHVAIWQSDAGAQRIEKDDLGDLVKALKAEFGSLRIKDAPAEGEAVPPGVGSGAEGSG